MAYYLLNCCIRVMLLLVSMEITQGKIGKIMSSITLLDEPDDLLFLNTMPSKLECPYEGYPKPKLTWENEKGTLIQSTDDLLSIVDDVLVFHAFLPSQYNKEIHNTKYRCEVSNEVGSVVSRFIKVEAVLDRRYSPVVFHQSAPLGGSAIFKCILPADEKDYIKVLAWKVIYPGGAKTRMVLSGMSIDGFNSLRTGQMVVSDVVQLHEQYKFACISQNILNNVTLTSSPARLFPNAPTPAIPSNLIHPKDQTIYSGESVTLNCDATAFPLPSFTWYKDGSRLRQNDRIKTITGGSIKILRSTVRDEGKYECLIEYKDEEKITLAAVVKIKSPLILTEKPKLVSTSTGQTATFNCQATGTKPFIVEWRKNGKLILNTDRTLVSTSTNSLVIADVLQNDEGMYQCVIKNDYEQVQAAARLVVDATLPSIVNMSPKVKLNFGSSTTISCRCTSTPQPKVTWYLDNEIIRDRNNEISIVDTIGIDNDVISALTLRNIQTKYSAAYKCVGENRVGKDSVETSIEVEGKPTIIKFPSEISGVSGRSLYIDCIGKGFPKVTHVWYKNGIAVQRSNRIIIHRNGTLELKRFGVSDIGKYWCIVDNKHGNYQADVQVVVLDPPQITPFTLSPVLVGRRAQYLCTSPGGSEKGFEITWYKNGLKVQENDHVKILGLMFSKALTFTQVSISDRGRYTCLIKNEAGETSYSADLVVYEKPSFIIFPVDMVVTNGHPVNLLCSATGFPLPQITWFKKLNSGEMVPVVLDHRIRQLNNGTLVIGYTQATDNGKYVCQASFFDKMYLKDPIQKEVSLDVRVPAKIVSTSALVVRNVKSRAVDLFCSVVGTPPLMLRWFKDNLEIADRSTSKYAIYRSLSHDSQPPVLNSSIQIRELSRNDNGKYECGGSNTFGHDKIPFKVFVEEEPSHPTDIEEVTSTSRLIHMKWTPGYDGNSPIIFYRVEMRGTSKSWDFGKFFIVNGNTSQYIVSDLKPGYEYTFRVNGRNKHGTSDWSTEAILKTKEEAPSAAPQNVSVKAIAKDKLHVVWHPPEKSKRNGIIIEYRIFFEPTARTAPMQNITTRYNGQYTLRHLLQFTSYRVQVQAFTRAGGGPVSLAVTASTLEGVPSKPPSNVDVQMVNSDTILVNWNPVPPLYVNGLLTGYKVIYTDISRRKKYQKIVSNSRHIQLTGLRKYTRYRIGVLAFTRAGDGELSDYIVGRTDEDVPDAPSRFSATAASPSEILVTWSPPLNRNGIIIRYTLFYTEIGKRKVNRIDNVQPEETSYMLNDLRLGRNYSVWMTADTSKGAGPNTKTVFSSTKVYVPAKIITPSGLSLSRIIGSNIKLPCAAVGHPKPHIIWYRRQKGDMNKNRRWMAADLPKELYDIKKSDAGDYNCSAVNAYGGDWNVITLVVQFPPLPPDILDARMVGQKDINISWSSAKSPKNTGYSQITQHYVNYIIDDGYVNRETIWKEAVVPAEQEYFFIANVTRDIVYLRIASENNAGKGRFSAPLKFEISGRGVGKFPTTLFSVGGQDSHADNLNSLLKPILIAAVVLITIIIILLFIASWDRHERRIRKPRCKRLVLCRCTCHKKRDFNEDPYGEPALPWPWNIKSNRHSGAFDMEDELLGSSEEQLEFKYAPNTNPNTNSLKKKFSTPSSSQFDFEPVVLFKSLSPKRADSMAKSNVSKAQSPSEGRNTLGRNDLPSYDEIMNRSSYKRNGQCDKPSIIEKYLRSQEQLENTNFTNKFADLQNSAQRDSIDSIDEPVAPPKHRTSRGSADGKSMDYNALSEYEEPNRQNSIPSDVPRVLLRGSSPGRRGKRGKNRKSLDSLILRALEDIEEKQVLSNEAVTDRVTLEQHAANVIKELLANPQRPYDSVSSTCSSSVGELRRAFEFGKKYGLQDYQVPALHSDDSDSEDDLDYQAHERLLNSIDVINFSEMPHDSNDIKLRIPLPIRMGSEKQTDEVISSDDELGVGGGYDRSEQSFV